MENTFSVTTAIYYANGPLHIGHAYEAVATDALARYHRALGKQVRFLTGADEHGAKVQRKADEAGVTPQAWVDAIYAGARALYDRLGISYDDFIRTTEERHRSAVQQIFTRLVQQGDIYLAEYEGWYCPHDEAFVTETRALEGRLCPECGRPLERTREATYKFRLSHYAPQVEALLAKPGFAVPEARRNEALAFVRQGLEDIAVSRTTVDWGIPVPNDPSHTIYVWVDALSNYITALGYTSGDDRLYRTFWPADLHVVGKDIARFHVVIWPALLLALGAPLPRQVYAHGWLTSRGQKIGKSLGNAVDPGALLDRYGVDAFRYFLLREVPFGPDANWSEESLTLRINTDLANDLGNLLSRTTQLIVKFAGGAVPEPSAASDGVLAAMAREALGALESSLAGYRIADALAGLWRLVTRANKYVDEQAPWALAKDPAQGARLGAVLYDLAEALRVTAGALTPFLVETPEQIYGQLGLVPGAVRRAPWAESTRWGGLAPGTVVQR
ncbi:MAG TPA: methionine--tRNA ligase, partial [Symbiobacteriaceae bacterium]|nr:methionine--tRNA ligase [Symbiobacteriaceae bacterium]